MVSAGMQSFTAYLTRHGKALLNSRLNDVVKEAAHQSFSRIAIGIFSGFNIYDKNDNSIF